MKKNTQQFSITNLWTLITIILSLHYYFSYRWITGILETYGLNSFAIINIQDVMFPFGNLNYTIISIASIGFIIIFYLKLIIKDKFYSKTDKNLEEEFKISISQFFTHKSLKDTIFKIIATLIFFILFYIICRYYVKNIGVFILILIVFVIIPIIYTIWVKKRTLILGGYIFIVFVSCNNFIDQIVLDAKNEKSENEIEVSFKYEKENINTNDSLIFLYQSYKYIILRDIKNEKNKLYENDKITFLTTKNTVKKRLVIQP